MLKPNEMEAISMSLDAPMRALENEVMSDIVRRIRINGEITRAADWQICRLHEMGASVEDIKTALKNKLNLTDEDINGLFTEAAQAGYAHDAAIYNGNGADMVPFESNKELQQMLTAVSEQTKGELKNITQSMGFAVRQPNGNLQFTPIAEYYQKTLDNAVSGIASGMFDYNTVIKRVISEMTKSGLRTVDYASGWSNRVDVAARRAIMTGLSQLTAKVNDQNAEALGTDMFEVTWHSGARPSHQEWQGKWYTKEQLVSVCGLGTVEGLCGANCYHDYYPVIPGVDKPIYSAEQLRRMNAEENKPLEYCDKKYTKYEALQRQRKLETVMRAERQKIRLLEEGGANEDDIINARCRYRGISQGYTAFSKAMNLPQQRARVIVDGLGDIGAGKWKLSGDKASAPLPRGYIDRRNVGEKIKPEELKVFADKAHNMNIIFSPGKNGSFGGFEDYRGDVRVLDELLEHINNNQPVLTKISGDDKIILKYINLLDGTGRIDTDTFAMTKGRTIYLNKFMFDDSVFLADEYGKAVSDCIFVQGTDYKNIVDHELGHIFARHDKRYISALNRVCENCAAAEGITKSEYVCNFVSKYADDNIELCAEINSMRWGGDRKFAEGLLRKAGLL